MKLSVCIDAVYRNTPVEKAISEIQSVGINTIEFWSWSEKNISQLQEIQRSTGLSIAAFCTGTFSLVNASQHEDYLKSLAQTIEVAKSLNCSTIISQTGAEEPFDRTIQHQNLVNGLKACVSLLEQNGITLVLEPLNIRVDHKGYYLSSSDECVDVLREVDSGNVKMLYDIYHQQITEGDLVRRIREYVPYIGHFHAAGNPGRHELDNSEINYQKIFDTIKETGYDRFVGLEYSPLEDPVKGLEYAKALIG